MNAICGLCDGKGWRWEETDAPEWVDTTVVTHAWWEQADCPRCLGSGVVRYGKEVA